MIIGSGRRWICHIQVFLVSSDEMSRPYEMDLSVGNGVIYLPQLIFGRDSKLGIQKA
jgi:hypothetical protein